MIANLKSKTTRIYRKIDKLTNSYSHHVGDLSQSMQVQTEIVNQDIMNYGEALQAFNSPELAKEIETLTEAINRYKANAISPMSMILAMGTLKTAIEQFRDSINKHEDSAAVRCVNRWREKNPYRTQYNNTKSSARVFVRRYATQDDLSKLEDLIKQHKED